MSSAVMFGLSTMVGIGAAVKNKDPTTARRLRRAEEIQRKHRATMPLVTPRPLLRPPLHFPHRVRKESLLGIPHTQVLGLRHLTHEGLVDVIGLARLEAEGRAWQAALHRQGFGTAPVDDLLTNISNALPTIQAEAKVTQLISKWNEPELKKHAGAEKIDVTMQLVDAFHPNERQRQHAIEIQTKNPAKLKE